MAKSLQWASTALQKMTSPGLTTFPPEVTVAVSVTTVPVLTESEGEMAKAVTVTALACARHADSGISKMAAAKIVTREINPHCASMTDPPTTCFPQVKQNSADLISSR